MKQLAYNTGREQWHYEYENFGVKYQLSIIQRIAIWMYPEEYQRGLSSAVVDDL